MKRFIPKETTPDDIKKIEEVLSSCLESPDSEEESITHIFSGISLIGFGLVGAIVSSDPLFDRFENLISEGENLTKNRKDIMIVEEYLSLRGFVRKDGSKDYVRFYNSAYISEGAWSKFYSGAKHQKSTSKDTLFKIIIALRMSLDDAMLFMQYAGSGFFAGSKRDMVIYAFIKNNYLDRDNTFDAVYAIYELIEYYSKKEISKPKPQPPLKQLYTF